MSERSRTLVLGAGVSGLSCALLLLERGHAVTVWTRDDPLTSTSAVAAALWYPFEAAPPERVEDWAVRSYVRFMELAREGVPGVRVEPLVDLHTPAIEPPGWARALDEFRTLEDAPERGFAQGWRARVPVIEMPLYLPWLEGRVRALGGSIERRTCTSLDETHGFDGVVNCTGLGSRELLGDTECYPIRGQIARVPRGEVSEALVFHADDGSFGYVVPRADDCVLGGTAERGESSLQIVPETTTDIVRRCRQLEPRVTERPSGAAVGLRPGRSVVRVELERLPDGRPLVHDYGHGGCGVTLSWACAEDALALLAGAEA